MGLTGDVQGIVSTGLRPHHDVVDLFLLISFPLAVCTLISFMRFLLLPWLLGFFCPLLFRNFLRIHWDQVGPAIVVAYLLCLVPFGLGTRLPWPYEQAVLGSAWFLMAFTAGRLLWVEHPGRYQARHLQKGKDAIAAAQQATRELQQ